MSALLASSFVGRVAAFKATKVQVRDEFEFFLASSSSSSGRRLSASRVVRVVGTRIARPREWIDTIRRGR